MFDPYEDDPDWAPNDPADVEELSNLPGRYQMRWANYGYDD